MFTPLIFDAISSPTCVAQLLGVVTFAGPGESWTLTVDREGFPLRLAPGVQRRARERRDHLRLLVHVVHSIGVAPPAVFASRERLGASAGSAAREARAAREVREAREEATPTARAGARAHRRASSARASRSSGPQYLDEIVLAPDGTWSRRYENPELEWAHAPFWRVRPDAQEWTSAQPSGVIPTLEWGTEPENLHDTADFRISMSPSDQPGQDDTWRRRS